MRVPVSPPSPAATASSDGSHLWLGGVAPLSRLRAAAPSAWRFLRHLAEMWLAMTAGMLLFHALPVSHALPALLHQVGMAVSMAAPMVVWMRVRGHRWRHGFEMAAGMLVPWAAVLGLVGLGTANALPWLAQADGTAMLLGMLGIMLVRRDHYVHGGAHQHAVAHAESRPARRVPWGSVFLVFAYLGENLLVPFVVGSANLRHKLFGPGEPLQAPTYSGQLPAPPTPDPSKKIAVVLSSAYGAEIGDSMEAFEVLARSAVIDWIRAHFGPHTTILGICSGTMTLADTGLLDGRTATSNTGTFTYVASHAPTTTWLHNLLGAVAVFAAGRLAMLRRAPQAA